MKKYFVAAALLAISASVIALYAGHAQIPNKTHEHLQHGGTAPAVPTMPGQDAFGAIQEIVGILEADPKTDWSKIDLESLRQHLIDMNDVTLNADVKSTPIDGGIEAHVTGTGRTVGAIQRMVVAHSIELEKLNGWSANTEKIPDGVRLTVTSSDLAQIGRIRGLGFIGLLASGAHHQPHHLAMAKGETIHAHK
jgi:hypothetical protein